MSEPVRCVCFDWGGVILRICRDWEQGCARADLPVRSDALLSDELRARRRAASMLYQAGAIDERAFFDRISEGTNRLYTPEEVRVVHEAWLIEEYPGVSGLIDELNALPDVETGLLSNTNPTHWATHMPGADGSPARFPTIGKLVHKHASHLLGASKPDEMIYRRFEDATGFSGGAILFFDDLHDNVEAARGRGWRSERIDHDGDPAEQMRTHLRTHGVL